MADQSPAHYGLQHQDDSQRSGGHSRRHLDATHDGTVGAGTPHSACALNFRLHDARTIPTRLPTGVPSNSQVTLLSRHVQRQLRKSSPPATIIAVAVRVMPATRLCSRSRPPGYRRSASGRGKILDLCSPRDRMLFAHQLDGLTMTKIAEGRGLRNGNSEQAYGRLAAPLGLARRQGRAINVGLA